jgi:hypothetical protein
MGKDEPMSDHWTLHCLDCEVIGPDIRRSHGFHFWPYAALDHYPEGSDVYQLDAQQAWATFMRQHGRHNLELLHESRLGGWRLDSGAAE